MAWAKSFIKAKIQKKKELYVATITYSYYGLYHYDVLSVFNTLQEAEHYLLYERCGGVIEIIEDEKN
jgi:hypothetical protein